MPDSTALLAQARAQQDIHDWTNSVAETLPVCIYCGCHWRCPDRLLADAVVSHLERCDAERAQAREHGGSISMHAVVLMQNTVEDSDDWFRASQALDHSEAIGALLGPDAARGPTEETP